MDPAGDALTPGQSIGRYEIVAPLGKGGMGEVYLAEDVTLGRKVALKVLPPAVVQDADRLRRFEQEARAASALNHPNILTIFETGDAGGRRFIATELVDGQTLRDRLAVPIGVTEALQIAAQVASALSAAHEAGIVHRDIKPENVMLRRDGYVKVLDFGLAKLVERDPAGSSDAETRVHSGTTPGLVLGTTTYMSPEQARGLPVDARSDIWSLGVVLYEMVSGRPPFRGATAIDTIAAIVTSAPPPLGADVPAELQRIVSKMLAADRAARYQMAGDVAADIDHLRKDLEFASRRAPGTATPLAAKPRRSVRAAIVFAGIAAAAALGLGGLGYAVWGRHAAVLSAKDTVLIADFDNRTGDAVFDDTLRQGLAMDLQQSQFLNIFPDVNVRDTLRQMEKPIDTRVTADVGRDICQRNDLKALIAGSIVALGRQYVVSLEAVNAKTGEAFARAQATADGKEQVLAALSTAASDIRGKLGEALGAIRTSDIPIYQLTTSSLDALKAFALAFDRSNRGKYFESIPLFTHATNLDPKFAYGYSLLAGNYLIVNEWTHAAQAATRAYELRDRVSEREKLYITAVYQIIGVGDLNEGIKTLGIYRQSYPGDFRPSGNLSLAHLQEGQFEQAIRWADESVRLNPSIAAWHVTLGTGLLRLNRFDEAKAEFDRAIAKGLDDTRLHSGLYAVAAIPSDAAGMQAQIDWARGHPDEYVAMDWQANERAMAGDWAAATDWSTRSVDAAIRAGMWGVAARFAADASIRAAALGHCDEADRRARQSATLDRYPTTRVRAALGLAWCGRVADAEAIAAELARVDARNTLVTGLWLPTVRAAIELQRHNAAGAVDQLRAAQSYETAAEFVPQYLRGLALESLGRPQEAAAEFRNILDHRGEGPLSALYTLARREAAKIK